MISGYFCTKKLRIVFNIMGKINPFGIKSKKNVAIKSFKKSSGKEKISEPEDKFTLRENPGKDLQLITPEEIKKFSSKKAPGFLMKFSGRLKHYFKTTMAMLLFGGALMGGPSAFAAGSFSEGENTFLEDKEVTNGITIEQSISSEEMSFYKKAGGVFEEIKDGKIEGEMGDYNLKVRLFKAKLRAKPKVKPKLNDGNLEMKWKAELKPKVELLRTELSKTEKQGDWTVTQGVKGSIKGEWKIGYEGEIDSTNSTTDVINEQKWQAGADTFKVWERDFSGGDSLRLSAVAGIGHEFVGNDTTAHVRFEQKYTGQDFEFMGHDFGWYAKAKEGASYNIQDDEFKANYELSAAVTKEIPMKAFGRDVDLKFELGPKIKGDIDEPVDFGAITKVKIDI